MAEALFIIFIDFLRLFSLDKYRQGHAKWSPTLLIQLEHWGAAGKFDYAYIRKIPNGFSVPAPQRVCSCIVED